MQEASKSQCFAHNDAVIILRVENRYGKRESTSAQVKVVVGWAEARAAAAIEEGWAAAGCKGSQQQVSALLSASEQTQHAEGPECQSQC